MKVSKYLWGDFQIEEVILWCQDNCQSFEKFQLVELSAEEKMHYDCWFRFDVYFADEGDATLYSLRWL